MNTFNAYVFGFDGTLASLEHPEPDAVVQSWIPPSLAKLFKNLWILNITNCDSKFDEQNPSKVKNRWPLALEKF